MESKAIEFWIEGDVVYSIFHNETITLEDVDFAIKERVKACGDNEYLMFVDIRKTKKYSREARARLAQKDGGKGVKGVAILINSKTHRVMFNFFASIYRAPAPAKMFTDREKAFVWLKSLK